MSILLGPEGTTVGCLSGGRGRVVTFVGSARHGLVSHTGFRWLGPVGSGRVGLGVVLWVVGWSFVENCTVDASIFVVKLSRADGGCLGTRSR